MNLANTLIDYVPKFQQGSDLLQQYIQTVGEILDEMGESVDDFKTYNDYAHISEDKLEDLSKSFGIDFYNNLDLNFS